MDDTTRLHPTTKKERRIADMGAAYFRGRVDGCRALIELLDCGIPLSEARVRLQIDPAPIPVKTA